MNHWPYRVSENQSSINRGHRFVGGFGVLVALKNVYNNGITSLRCDIIYYFLASLSIEWPSIVQNKSSCINVVFLICLETEKTGLMIEVKNFYLTLWTWFFSTLPSVPKSVPPSNGLPSTYAIHGH